MRVLKPSGSIYAKEKDSNIIDTKVTALKLAGFINPVYKKGDTYYEITAKKSDFEILISDSIEKNKVLNIKKNLPGYRDSDGYFKELNKQLVIWSSDERFNNCIEALVLSKNNVKMDCYSPSQGYSIRLIKTYK